MPGLVRRVGVCVSVWGGYGGVSGFRGRTEVLEGKKTVPCLTLPQTLSLLFHYEGFWVVVRDLGGGMKAEVKNGESDE